MNTTLKTGLLATCLLLAFQTHAASNIGRVIFASGDIRAENNGEVRTLKRGAYIKAGDKVVTGSGSRSQLRMTDGALFALRPNTKMNFEDYRYNRESKSGSSILSLIKGGFRTITGLIGRYNKKNYSVRTSVATIGVRGTHFGLTLCQQNDCVDNGDGNFEDGLYGSVVDGEIVAKNQAGEFHFTNDEYFQVSGPTDKPRTLLKPPGIIFDQAKFVRHQKAREKIKEKLKQTAALHNIIETRQEYIRNQVEKIAFESGEDAKKNRINLIKAENGSTIAFSMTPLIDSQGAASAIGVAGKVTSANATNNTIVLDANEKDFLPVVVEQNKPAANISRALTLGPGKPVDIASGKIGNIRVSWGRWSKDYIATQNDVPLPHVGQLHFVFAENTTTPEQLASLRVAAGGTFAYQSIDGTRPTDLAGNQAQSFADVQIWADFGQETLDYSVSTTVNGVNYTASGFAAGTGAIANVMANGIALNDGYNSIINDYNTATGSASVAFIGDNAGGAISAFELQHDTETLPDGSPNRVTGAALLQGTGNISSQGQL